MNIISAMKRQRREMVKKDEMIAEGKNSQGYKEKAAGNRCP
jgi:hypothetical protein